MRIKKKIDLRFFFHSISFSSSSSLVLFLRSLSSSISLPLSVRVKCISRTFPFLSPGGIFSLSLSLFNSLGSSLHSQIDARCPFFFFSLFPAHLR